MGNRKLLISPTFIAILAAVFAGCSAFIAYQSLTQANNFFQIAQRPYITIKNIRLDALPNTDHLITIETLIKNTGLTPALNVEVLQQSDLLLAAPTSTPHNFKINSRITLGAGSESTVRVVGHRPFNSNELNQINSGQATLYLTGTVIYDDVFQREHQTEFCAFFNPKEQTDPLALEACPNLNVVQ